MRQFEICFIERRININTLQVPFLRILKQPLPFIRISDNMIRLMMILVQFHRFLCPLYCHLIFAELVMTKGKAAWYGIVVRIFQITLGKPLNSPIEHLLFNKCVTKSIVNPSVFWMFFYQFAQKRYLEVDVLGDQCVYQCCVLVILVDLHCEFRPFFGVGVIKGLIAVDVGNALVSLVKSRVQVNRLPVASLSFLEFLQFVKNVPEAKVQLFAKWILTEHFLVPSLSTRYIIFESEAQRQSIIRISMYSTILS